MVYLFPVVVVGPVDLWKKLETTIKRALKAVHKTVGF
jgi:hypothetical protein